VEGKVGVTGSGKPVTEQTTFRATEVTREKKIIKSAEEIIKEEKRRY